MYINKHIWGEKVDAEVVDGERLFLCLYKDAQKINILFESQAICLIYKVNIV